METEKTLLMEEQTVLSKYEFLNRNDGVCKDTCNLKV